MTAKIYAPQKTAMQSGKATADRWVLVFERSHRRTSDPLMGWYGNQEPDQQVRLTFDRQEEAVAFARREGLAYRVIEKAGKSPKGASYADNFAPGRKQAWTH